MMKNTNSHQINTVELIYSFISFHFFYKCMFVFVTYMYMHIYMVNTLHLHIDTSNLCNIYYMANVRNMNFMDIFIFNSHCNLICILIKKKSSPETFKKLSNIPHLFLITKCQSRGSNWHLY